MHPPTNACRRRMVLSLLSRMQVHMLHVLFSFGTRPEAIKLAPVIKHLQSLSRPLPRVGLSDIAAQGAAATGDGVSSASAKMWISTSWCTIRRWSTCDGGGADEHADMSSRSCSPTCCSCRAIRRRCSLLPLAAFYQKVRVGHVEAGCAPSTATALSPRKSTARSPPRWPTSISPRRRPRQENLRREGTQ
jgi:hypothetical protein